MLRVLLICCVAAVAIFIFSPAIIGFLAVAFAMVAVVFGGVLAVLGVLFGGLVSIIAGLASLIGVQVCQVDHKIDGDKHSYHIHCGTTKPVPAQKISI